VTAGQAAGKERRSTLQRRAICLKAERGRYGVRERTFCSFARRHEKPAGTPWFITCVRHLAGRRRRMQSSLRGDE
jgi:hypothetical protein